MTGRLTHTANNTNEPQVCTEFYKRLTLQPLQSPSEHVHKLPRLAHVFPTFPVRLPFLQRNLKNKMAEVEQHMSAKILARHNFS